MNLLVPVDYDYKFTLGIEKKLKREIYIQFKLGEIATIKLNVELNKQFKLEDDPLLIIDIVTEALKNIVIIKEGKYYNITLNKEVNYLKTKIKLIDLIKFITFGNLSAKGFPAFENVAAKLKKKLPELYEIYAQRGIVI